MKKRSIKKWLLGITILILISTLTSYLYIDYELDAMYGGHVEKVDFSSFKQESGKIMIKNVSVFSADSMYMIPSQNVFLENGKIIAIDTLSKPVENMLIVEGEGKYLIPGLIDSHIHLLQSPNDLLLYLANGVTGIREMTGTEQHIQWKKEIEQGKRIGPELFISSEKLNSYEGIKKWFTEWTQPVIALSHHSEISNGIQKLKTSGFQAFKIGTFLEREHYLEVSRVSREIGIPMVGHIPMAIELEDLWQSNQTEVAHIEEFVKLLNREFGGYESENTDEFLRFVEKRGTEISKEIVKNDIAVTSTLWLMDSFLEQKADLTGILGDIQLQYVNPGLAEGTPITSRGLGWLPDVNIYRWPDEFTDEQKEGSKIYWKTYSDASQILLRAMVKEGVKILAGTDANCPVTVPGFSLHDELKLMKYSGMSPAQVLQSATLQPSKWMGTNTGKIAVGYDADLVLLSKNPLENIENTSSIEIVFSKGRVFDKETIDQMMAEVLKANEESRSKDIEQY